jgi:hypothetical protein
METAPVVSAVRNVLIRIPVVMSVPMIRLRVPNVIQPRTSSSMMENAEISARAVMLGRRSRSRLLEAQKHTPVRLKPIPVV